MKIENEMKNKHVISLNGLWNVCGSIADAEPEFSLNANVPGQIHDDLIRAKIIPDPLWRDQAQKCQWVEQRDWCYTNEFEWSDDLPGDWQVLECEGLDTSCKGNG